MASSAALLSAYSCSRIASTPSTSIRIPFVNSSSGKKQQKTHRNLFRIRASSDEQDDCNVDECAPDKEVGKVSMEWLAGEKTKVVGTSPPRKRDWSGYVEKDTAGQTNIYSVEPAVYVAESAISSGSSGTSADGSENTAAIIGGLALIAIAAASSILINIGKKPPQIQTTFDYSGPSLTYYINKFKATEIIQDSPPIEAEAGAQVPSISPEPETSTPEVPQVQVESDATSTS